MKEKEFSVYENGKPAVMDTPSKKKRSFLNGLTVVVLIVVSFAVGVFAAREILPQDSSTGPIKDSKFRIIGDIKGENADVEDVDFGLFWNVWNQMTRDYVSEDKVDQKEMLYGAIKGLVNSYDDRATVFLTPEETNEFNDSSAGSYFSGIGAELGYKNGQIVVISPIKGSPAIAAGIRPGDAILMVDGEPIDPEESIYDVVYRIRGEEGTKVVLTVLHRGDKESKEIEITRGQITIPSMDFAMVEGENDIVVFDIARFTDESVSAWQDNWDSIVEQFRSSGAKGIIVDLRGNPGGFVNSAQYAAEEFMENGELIAILEGRNGERTEYKVSREGDLTDVPIIVLVNEGSASASEILSGALQKSDRAKVVGVTTYGKGTAQDIVNLPDGSSLHITVMKWLLPDGSWINPDNPIVPDVEIELTDEDFVEGSDPQMDKAIEMLNEEIK